jgi:hypothetical protein
MRTTLECTNTKLINLMSIYGVITCSLIKLQSVQIVYQEMKWHCLFNEKDWRWNPLPVTIPKEKETEGERSVLLHNTVNFHSYLLHNTVNFHNYKVSMVDRWNISPKHWWNATKLVHLKAAELFMYPIIHLLSDHPILNWYQEWLENLVVCFVCNTCANTFICICLLWDASFS